MSKEVDMGGLLILFAQKDQAHVDRDPDALDRIADELAAWVTEQPEDERLRVLVAESVRVTHRSATALRALLIAEGE